MLNQDDLIKKCLDKLALYSKTLGLNLAAKVYQEKDRIMIETIRYFLDLETLSLKLKLSGSAHVAAIQSCSFVQKSRELVPAV